MTENKRFKNVEINHMENLIGMWDYDTWHTFTKTGLESFMNELINENEQLIKDNFELQGLLGDVRALLRLDKVDDAISRIDKFERSMKK